MPTPKFDDEPQLEPNAPHKRRGALFLLARAQFDHDYERVLNNIMLQQGNVVATLGSGE